MWHEVRGTHISRGRSGRGGQASNNGGTPTGNTGKTNTKLTVGQEMASRQNDPHADKTRNIVMMPPRGKSDRGVRTTNKGGTPAENGIEKSSQPMVINEIERGAVIQNNYARNGMRGRMEKTTHTPIVTTTERHEERTPAQ